MKQAYTPALAAAERTRITKQRELPLPGKHLVAVGDRVTAEQTVLSAELPGDMSILRLADRMGLEPFEAVEGMKVAVGDHVTKGQLLCEVVSFFGLCKSRFESPVEGKIEFFTDVNAHLGIRHEPEQFALNAYIDGRVVEVRDGQSVTIETDASFVQGIFGVGGERLGTIYAPEEIAADAKVDVEALSRLGRDLGGAIIVGGACYTGEALREAGSRGAVGVICGSIDSSTLGDYVGAEIGVSVTGDENVPCTLIITEGFGRLAISSRVLEILRKADGRRAAINGATQVRAGASRPEIIIPLSAAAESAAASVTTSGEELTARVLEVGARARIIRVPYFGEFGKIVELPPEPQQIESGAVVRVLRAVLDSGEEIVVPRANVELV